MKFGVFIAVRQIIRNKKKSIPVFLCMFIAYSLLINMYGIYESYKDMIERSTKEEYGAYHCYITNASDDEYEKLMKSALVDKVGNEYVIGEFPLDKYNEKETDKEQIISLTSMDAACFELNMLRLVRGELPDNSGEIVLSAGTELDEGYSFACSDSGDKIELEEESGIILNYTVTGVLDNFNASQTDNIHKAIVNESDSAGEAYIQRNLYVSVTAGGDMYSKLDDIAKELGIEDGLVFRTGNRLIDTREALEDYHMIYNSELLGLINEGTPDDSERSVIYITQILIAFILIISAMVIWNVFSIRIEERRKEYGLLRICGVSPAKLVLSVMLENGIIYVMAVVSGVLLAGVSKNIMQAIIQYMRIHSMGDMNISISPFGIIAGAVYIGAVVTIITLFITVRLLKSNVAIEMLNDSNKEKTVRKRAKSRVHKHQTTAAWMIGSRSVRRNKAKSISIVMALGVVVLFFVTLSCFLEVLAGSKVTDVTEIPASQYVISRSFEDDFPKEFIDSIPNKELCYTASVSQSDFHISPSIKNEKLKQYYNRYYSSYTSEEVFSWDIVSIEVDGIGKEAYDELEWFDTDKIDYEEWIRSGKALIDDICVSTDKNGAKTYDYQLNIRPGDCVLSYDGCDEQVDDGKRISFDAGEVDIIARVGHKLYCREDNMIVINILLPEEVVREKFDPALQLMYINARDGKEIELGAWLKNNQAKYGYTISDTVKEYAAAYDTGVTSRVVIAVTFILVVIVSIIHIYNIVKSSLGMRRKEFGILMALGMSRWKIMKSLLWEHAVYGVAGGIIGGVLSMLLLERLLILLSGASKVNLVIPVDYMCTGVCGVIVLSMAVVLWAARKIDIKDIAKEVGSND